MKEQYTVFVGGFEVNDYYLTFSQAESLAYEFKIEGYFDVAICKIEDN